jgi:hypothetical protein
MAQRAATARESASPGTARARDAGNVVRRIRMSREHEVGAIRWAMVDLPGGARTTRPGGSRARATIDGDDHREHTSHGHRATMMHPGHVADR